MMESMIQVATLAIVAVIATTVMRRGAPELTIPLIMGAGALVMMMVAEDLGNVMETMNQLTTLSGLDNGLVIPVAKTVVLSILTKVTGELCRSAGESAMASFVEIAGTMLALAVAIPLIEGVIVMLVDTIP